ncbi:PLP-dependent transferase [Marasmius fiardii PR-910]|nr:PLP-dependent transferase [Marasmius fiardii PR-910]
MSLLTGFRLSRTVLSTISPPIPQAYKWALSFASTGDRPLLDMSQGVPGTPPHESLQKAFQTMSTSRNTFGYGPAEGEEQLRAGLVEEMKENYGKDADLEVEDIAVTAGCNMAFVASIMSLADAGDEVILPMPWYFNHQMTLSLLGIGVVPLQTRPEDGFIPSIEARKSLVTPKTRAIALVTPNYPTGATYPPSLIASFASLASANNIALILDETYHDFIIPRSPPHLLFSSPSWRSTLIHLYSFSKSYRIPGHRLGCIAANPTLIPHIIKILDTLQICAPKLPQIALGQPGMLRGMRDDIHDTAVQVANKHQIFERYLSKRWWIASQGGFYASVRHPFLGIESTEVCERLAKEMGVVVLPGAFFGHRVGGEDDCWIRFSVANVNEELVKWVCERMGESEGVFGDWEISS